MFRIKSVIMDDCCTGVASPMAIVEEVFTRIIIYNQESGRPIIILKGFQLNNVFMTVSRFRNPINLTNE